MNGPKPVSAVVANLRHEAMPAVQSAPAIPVDNQAKAVIDDLFGRLKGIYPAWKQAWPTEAELNAAKLEWLAEFMRAGIRRVEQIQHGVRMAARHRSAFAPAPGVFVSWCFAPEAFGLPPLESAYKQSLRNTHPSQAGHCKWSHAAIYHASVAAGWYSLQRLEPALGMKRFEEKYLEQCQKLGRGEELEPVPVAALPEQAGPRTPEVGRAALAALRQKVGGGRG